MNSRGWVLILGHSEGTGIQFVVSLRHDVRRSQDGLGVCD